MPEITEESLLQEIATEMAFLMPGQITGVDRVVAALDQLANAPGTQALGQAQQEIAWSVGLCEQALEGDKGLTLEHLNGLQAAFERLTNVLYLSGSRSHSPAAAALTAESTTEPFTPKVATDAQDQGTGRGAERVDQTEPSFCITPDDDLELLNEFCNEGRDLLHQVEQGVLVLEETPQHKDTLHKVFRAFHTFKGGAGFLGIDPIKELAHQLESVLDAARRDQLDISRAVIELILAGGDALQCYVDAIARQLAGDGMGSPIVVPTSALIEKAKACLDGTASSIGTLHPSPVTASALAVSQAGSAHQRPDTPPSDAAPPLTPSAALTPTHPMPSGSPPGVATLTATAPPLRAAKANMPAAQPRARAESLAQFVKLDTRKLDALVDLMGELVIAQSMVVQHPLVARQNDRELERHLRQLARITTDLQHNAMSLRMVPIRSVFQKMTRLVRDLASVQNKQVQLHLSGEDTELDRNIVEALGDPLLHMMRNAVDHGIEWPEERLSRGKTSQGNIYLSAAHQGGGILIRMRDDGKGLDSEKILAKAIQRGLIDAGSATGEKDIYNLIFLPGFSTADKVTDISGRGVGMDVVRGSIQALRGRVDIQSVPGEGTTFEIFLPLTLAIIDGMLVGVGSERFIVPTLTVRESLRPRPDMVFTVQRKGEVISVRGKLMPLVRLSDKLGIASHVTEPCDGIVMVVDSGGRQLALLVDSLLGKQEVVIKSLGETFKHHRGMSGAAIMGDGRVALIIDPDAISQLPEMRPLAA